MFTKLVRIGRDAELKTTATGKSVIGLACVYDIGWGENKKGQWIEVSIWGKQAEALSPFLLKGKQIVISVDDVELETYQKNDSTTGSKLKCRAVNIDLVGSKQDGQNQQQSPQQQAPQNQQQRQPNQPQQGQEYQPAKGPGGHQTSGQPNPADFNNTLSDDIPF